MFRFALALGLAFAAAIAGAAPGPAAVDDARLRAADADAANWMSHGRTYAEQRFSPLDQINARQRRRSSASPGADLDTSAAWKRRRSWSTA